MIDFFDHDHEHKRDLVLNRLRNTRQGELILMGYWRDPDETQWPDPRRFVFRRWNGQEKKFTIEYLKNGFLLWHYRGKSWCRFRCRKHRQWNGSSELTDRTYLWPDGLVHYLEKHHLALPEAFIQHARRTIEAFFESHIMFDRQFFSLYWKKIRKSIVQFGEWFEEYKDPDFTLYRPAIETGWWQSQEEIRRI